MKFGYNDVNAEAHFLIVPRCSVLLCVSLRASRLCVKYLRQNCYSRQDRKGAKTRKAKL